MSGAQEECEPAPAPWYWRPVPLWQLLLVIGLLGLLILPLVPKILFVRQRSAEAVVSNPLKQIGMALRAYHDKAGTLPPRAIESPEGKPLLSWRVALLPYVEQEALYNQFRLDEPWDSDHNKRLIPMIPRADLPLWPKDRPDPGGRTPFQAVVGRGLIFDPTFRTEGRRGRRLTHDIPDGLPGTVLVVFAKDPVIWTKPEDIDADDGQLILPRLDDRLGAPMVLFADGSVRMLPKEATDRRIRPALTVAGGEPDPFD